MLMLALRCRLRFLVATIIFNAAPTNIVFAEKPTLTETMQFISDALETDGEVPTVSFQGESLDRKIVSAKASGCNLDVTWRHELHHADVRHSDSTTDYSTTLPMRLVREVNEAYGIGIRFELRKRLTVYERTTTSGISEVQGAWKHVSETESLKGELVLPIRNDKAYDRVSRAFRYALKLCGREKEPF
jgi:hypothetical protein